MAKLKASSQEIPPGVSALIRSLLQRQGVRQLIKFCIVGASNLIIDKGLLWLFTKSLNLLVVLYWVPWYTWTTVTFFVAVTNSFIWNRRWTFRIQDTTDARKQYIKFFATNAVGYVLNQLITKMFLILFTGQVIHEKNPDADHLFWASICAVPFVVIWNFSATKYWTFRAPKTIATTASQTEDNTQMA